MFDFLLLAENLPFAITLAVMLGIALLEGITTLLGAALSGFLDALLPDSWLELSHDVASVEFQAESSLAKLLGWLRVGQVPMLMLLVIFLTTFGLMGLSLQSVVHALTGHLLPAGIATIPALMMTFPVVRALGGLLHRIMPKDETDAVSEDSLVGRLATITLGQARPGSPAEAKVRDGKGTTHYVMVEPDLADNQFSTGEDVLLVRRAGHVFRAIKNTNKALTNKN